MQLSHPLGSWGFAVRLNEKQSYSCNSDYKLLEKRLFVIGFGQRASERAKGEQSNSANKCIDGDKKETAKKNQRGAGRGYSTGAMATAVSSGDDLTDFQSQPRSGQRLVSPAGERGRRGVAVQFGLSLLCGRCCCCWAALRCLGHFAADIYIYFYFIFIFTLSYMFACLTVSLSVCPLSRPSFVSLTLCLFAASTFAGCRSSEPTVTATSTRGVARGGRNIRNAFPCGVEINCE